MIPYKLTKTTFTCNYNEESSQIQALQNELNESKTAHQNCVAALKELMFLNTHKVRQSICQILSLSDLLERSTCLSKICLMAGNLKLAAISLDAYSKNMTLVMEKHERNGLMDNR